MLINTVKGDIDMNENLHDEKQLVEEFMKFEGINIYDLKTFDFKKLSNYNKQKKQQFACSGREFDCDDTDIVRAIYILLWSNDINDLNFKNIGGNERYRGDTINTYSHIFSIKENVIDRMKQLDEKLYIEYESAKENFYCKYHTIGNFVILPNTKLIPSNRRSQTLNKYRNSCFKDDFFKFVKKIEYLYDNVKKDEEICTNEDGYRWYMLYNNNDYFFNNNNLDTYERFINTLFLTSYKYETKRPYALKITQNSSDEKIIKYMKDAIEYSNISIDLIEKRSEIMIRKLETKLK